MLVLIQLIPSTILWHKNRWYSHSMDLELNSWAGAQGRQPAGLRGRLWAQWGPALFSLPTSPPPIIPVSPTLQGSCKQQPSRGFLKPGKLHEWRLIVYYFFSLFCRRLWGVSPFVLRFALVLLVIRFQALHDGLLIMSLVLQGSHFTLASGLGILSDLPHVTQLRFGLQFDGEGQGDHYYFLLFWAPCQALCHLHLMGMGVPVLVLRFFLSGLSTLREEILTSAFFFFCKQIRINHFAHTFSNYNFDLWMPVPSFFSNLCGLLWCGDAGCHVCLPPALLPSLGSLLSSLWICFLSLPIHIPASLFFILQLKLLLQWALKLFWCSACCGNKLSLTPSCTACVLLMEYVVCVCMRFSCKKDCGLQERPGRCSKSRGVFLESSSCNSLRSCFNSVTSWLPTACADYTDFSKAYILCSPLHVRINKDTWE